MRMVFAPKNVQVRIAFPMAFSATGRSKIFSPGFQMPAMEGTTTEFRLEDSLKAAAGDAFSERPSERSWPFQIICSSTPERPGILWARSKTSSPGAVTMLAWRCAKRSVCGDVCCSGVANAEVLKAREVSRNSRRSMSRFMLRRYTDSCRMERVSVPPEGDAHHFFKVRAKPGCYLGAFLKKGR